MTQRVRRVNLSEMLGTHGPHTRTSHSFPGHENRMRSHAARVLRENPESVGWMGHDPWECPRCGDRDPVMRDGGQSLCIRCAEPYTPHKATRPGVQVQLRLRKGA